MVIIARAGHLTIKEMKGNTPGAQKEVSERLVDAVLKLASAKSIADVAEIVRVSARSLVESDGATFVIRSGDQCHYLDEDAITPLWKGHLFPLESCISGWAMLNKQQVAIEDIYADPRIPHEAYRPTFVKSLIMTPVRANEPIAAIGTYWACQREATENEKKLLQTLADSTAVALANVHLLTNLEQMVKDRTEALEKANCELQEARDRALEASALKSAFVANLSHELRTPLSGIVSTAELLSADRLESDQRKLVDILTASSTALLGILNDILDLAKIEAGRTTLEEIPFNVMFVVQDATRAMSVAAASKQLSLRLNMDYGLPELVNGDPVRLRQVLLNLIGNAVKFTEQGEIVVEARLESRTDDSTSILFSVTDTGIGIRQEDLPHLFTPFTQGDKSITRRFGGTGLGLSISKQLVELMGGTLVCQSKRDEGTKFFFSVPFKKPIKAPLVGSSAQTSAFGEKFHGLVLVVEDNKFISELTLRQLANLGVQAVVVENGKLAVESASETEFDLILMDCSLPELDGFEATRRIREFEKGKLRRTPIVALTAGVMAGDDARCFEAGMDGFLAKPLTLKRLEETLAHWLGREQKQIN